MSAATSVPGEVSGKFFRVTRMKGGFWATGWDQGTPWGEGNRPEWGPQDLAAKALPVPGGLASGRPLIDLSGSADRHTSLGQSLQPEGCDSGSDTAGGPEERRGSQDNQMVAPTDTPQERKSVWNWADGHFHPCSPSEGSSIQVHSEQGAGRADADLFFLFKMK